VGVAGCRIGRTAVSQLAFLHRLRRLFGGEGPDVESIAAALSDRRARTIAHPMSDQELARAIREVQGVPASEAALKNLSDRLAAAKPDRPS